MKKVRVAPKRLSSLDCTLREKSGRSWGVEEFNWIRPSKGTGPGRGDSGVGGGRVKGARVEIYEGGQEKEETSREARSGGIALATFF